VTVAVVELAVPARSEYLALVRLAIAAAAAQGPTFPDARLDDLRLAVSEACANAFKAHSHSTSAAPVRIRCEVSSDGVTVAVEDRGGGFDPAVLEPLPAAGDPDRLEHEHGLGLPIMQDLADEVRFERSADGTVVRLRIGRSPEP
jgi:anti-sigma regulatory factor (Ser/Thr protein kinase)